MSVKHGNPDKGPPMKWGAHSFDKGYTSDSEITYHFDASHIDMVEKKIKICEYLIGEYVNDSSYKIIDDGDEITYDYTTPSNMIATDIELIARLCLGKQILYCLRKNGECFFTAEL